MLKHKVKPEVLMFASQNTKTPRELANDLSLINVFTAESYYTRGAFLDVVVNQQMCKSGVLQVDRDAYIDSFTENVAEHLIHSKQKYHDRATAALAKLTTDGVPASPLAPTVSTSMKIISSNLYLSNVSDIVTHVAARLSTERRKMSTSMSSLT
jgi:hypothetical protein